MTPRPRYTYHSCLAASLTLFLLIPAARAADPQPAVALSRLLVMLGSEDYAERETAGQRLLQLGDAALPGLDDALHSPDAEVRRQARELSRRIRTVSREREVKKILDEINAMGLDRFIERMVKEKDYATEERWSKTIEMAMAVGERGVEFGGPEFAGWRHVVRLPVMQGFNQGGRINGRGLLNGLDEYRPQINNAVVLSTRLSGRLRTVGGSVLIVNGDLDHVDSIDSSIVIVNGDISDVYYLRNSVVLVTGRIGRVRSQMNSVIQAKSMETCYDSRGGVYLNLPRPSNDEDTGDLVLKTTRGPLDLFRFSTRTEAPAAKGEGKER